MTQQEVIKTFMQSFNNTTLKGSKALDEAIKASSKFKSFKELRTQFLKDIKKKNWHTFLVQKCGIILDNKDTGAISGSDAGGKKTKTATDILPSKGKVQYPEGSSFTVDDLTIYGIPPKKFLTADQQYVVQGLYSWWIRDSLALIKESYGLSFNDTDTTNSRLKIKFVDDPDDTSLASVSYESDDDKIYESRTLCVNMAKFKNMSIENRHGSTDGSALDRILIHELVHGLMASNINYYDDLPDFLAEGGTAELIHGLDDENYDEIVEYAKDPEVFEKILTTKIFDDPPYEIYAGGYIFMRYFAKQAADTTFDYDKYRKTVSVKNNFATNYFDTVTMKGGKGSDTITNSGSKVSIGAAAGNDTIKNYGDTVKINAGAGNDFIFNEGEKVTILGGKGNDSVENTGDDVTISGDDNNDYISNLGDFVSIAGGKGNDSIINDISDYYTLKAITDDELEEGIQTKNGVTVETSDGDYYSADLYGGTDATLTGGAGKDSITNYSSEVLIYGDAGNDLITNFGFKASVYGGDDNDVILNDSSETLVEEDTVSVAGYQSEIYGGNGNDSIYNKVDKVKIYGENGADTVSNYGWSVSIIGGVGVDSVENDGDEAYILLGDGDDVIKNSADSVVAKGGNGEDYFNNFGEDTTLNGGEAADFINNYGDYSSLAGDKGDDFIYSCGKQATLTGGDGNDDIYNEGVKAYLLGGAGNDTLWNEGDHVTISGGADNDEIENWGGRHITYEFGKNDGKDIVEGFNANDTIKITSGTHSVTTSGSDVIVTVGKATLTLTDAADKKINFISASGKKTTKTYSASKATSRMWFLEENNFATSDNLSSLVKGKEISASYSELETSTSLTKKNNPITYSGKK